MRCHCQAGPPCAGLFAWTAVERTWAGPSGLVCEAHPPTTGLRPILHTDSVRTSALRSRQELCLAVPRAPNPEECGRKVFPFLLGLSKNSDLEPQRFSPLHNLQAGRARWPRVGVGGSPREPQVLGICYAMSFSRQPSANPWGTHDASEEATDGISPQQEPQEKQMILPLQTTIQFPAKW